MNEIPAIRFRRQILGISAAYLPWTDSGEIDLDSYHRQLDAIWNCGLIPAINMDTGFANLISEATRKQILDEVARSAKGRAFVAGAFVEDLDGDMAQNYVRHFEWIANAGGTPILFQCSALARMNEDQILTLYQRMADVGVDYYAFELGRMFVPFGQIYSLDLFQRLLDVPRITGIKHSSLSRGLEWQRLAVRDAQRPEFYLFTGNDLAIDMVQWGSDYLLGLSAFYPEAFAKRDTYWLEGDSRFYELNDRLQTLGSISFRDPVPAYKHNCGMALKHRGRIHSDALPPGAASRSESDRELLVPILDEIDRLLR